MSLWLLIPQRFEYICSYCLFQIGGGGGYLCQMNAFSFLFLISFSFAFLKKDLGSFFPKFNKYVESVTARGVQVLELNWVDDQAQV
jgi:hypothetical protein